MAAKTRKVVKKKLKEIKSDNRANSLLKFFKKTGLFRWEKPASESEEMMNVLTHGIGIGLAIAALALLVIYAAIYGDAWSIVSTAIFGITMITLYFGSTMCHMSIGKKSECFFEVWDSVAIYALIAGTYTPFCLVNMRGIVGWVLFGILWSIAIFGAVMKIKNPKNQPKWMVLLYLAMGWALIFVLPVMIKSVPDIGLWFILSGALSYSIGVIFYLWRKMKYSHALWHIFVIGGSVSFFFAVLFGSVLYL